MVLKIALGHSFALYISLAENTFESKGISGKLSQSKKAETELVGTKKNYLLFWL